MFAFFTLISLDILLWCNIFFNRLGIDQLFKLLLRHHFQLLLSFILDRYVRIKLPLHALGIIRSKPRFINTNDHSIVTQKLSQKSTDPKSFFIESLIKVAIVCSLELLILEMEMLLQHVTNDRYRWCLFEDWRQVNFQMLLQYGNMVQSVYQKVIFQQPKQLRIIFKFMFRLSWSFINSTFT